MHCMKMALAARYANSIEHWMFATACEQKLARHPQNEVNNGRQKSICVNHSQHLERPPMNLENSKTFQHSRINLKFIIFKGLQILV